MTNQQSLDALAAMLGERRGRVCVGPHDLSVIDDAACPDCGEWTCCLPGKVPNPQATEAYAVLTMECEVRRYAHGHGGKNKPAYKVAPNTCEVRYPWNVSDPPMGDGMIRGMLEEAIEKMGWRAEKRIDLWYIMACVPVTQDIPETAWYEYGETLIAAFMAALEGDPYGCRSS